MQTVAIRRVAPADRTKEALDIIVEAVLQAAAQVADVDLHTVDGDAAGHVAQGLASPLLRLTQLRQSPLMRRPPSIWGDTREMLVMLVERQIQGTSLTIRSI
jgi:hypothetical protein